MNSDKRVTIRYREILYSALGLRQGIQGRINLEVVQTLKKECFSHLEADKLLFWPGRCWSRVV